MTYALVLPSILGSSVLVSYYMIFSNSEKSYVDSRFWLGMPKHEVQIAVFLYQIPAALGFIRWMLWAYLTGADKGLLTYRFQGILARDWIVNATLVGSLIWPWTLPSHREQQQVSLASRYITGSSLWLSAVSTILLVGGTFEANNVPLLARFGLLSFATVIVLYDGVGWSARYIHSGLAS